MEMLQFEKEYRIHVYEIGPDGRLSIFSLFNFLQDIAAEHAVKLRFGRDDLMRENRFWVLSRVMATISLWPEWEETIIVRTWPKGTEKLFALRDFEVFYPDGKHIASASSSWLVVDRTTKRVQRPDDLLTRFNSGLPVKNALGRNAAKIESSSPDGTASDVFRIKISDLDVNLHTNNVRYIEWVTDTYDLEFRTNLVPVSVEVNYLAESKWNEEIYIRTSSEGKNGCAYNHSIIRSIDKIELCRIRIEWKDCRH
jgi:medium-chain acyl-[acyl-carrier-protein] hydrolase